MLKVFWIAFILILSLAYAQFDLSLEAEKESNRDFLKCYNECLAKGKVLTVCIRECQNS